jgi:hypothetical protein
MSSEFDRLLDELRIAEEDARLAVHHQKIEAKRRAAEARGRFAKSLKTLHQTKAIVAKANQATSDQRRDEVRERLQDSYAVLKSLAAEGKVSGIEAAIAENRISRLLYHVGAPR